MKFYLDSAKVDEIRYARDMWNIDGVTSNPRHVRNSGKPFLVAIRDIAKEFEGTDKPISVEVNPHHTTAEAMVEEGVKLAAMSPNFRHQDSGDGSRLQGAVDAQGQGHSRQSDAGRFRRRRRCRRRAWARRMSRPSSAGRKPTAKKVSHLVAEIVRIYRNYDYKTEIIVAAVRNARQIVESAVAGAHIVTAGFDVYKDAFDHPYTAKGLKLFADNWDATPYE